MTKTNYNKLFKPTTIESIKNNIKPLELPHNELLDLDGDELLDRVGVPYKEVDDEGFISWFVTSDVMLFIERLHNGRCLQMDPDKIMLYMKIVKALEKHLEASKRFGSKCPKEGEFYGYKAVLLDKDTRKSDFEFGIVKLKVSDGVRRVSPFFSDGKCRCSSAFVEEIYRVEVNRLDDTTSTFAVKRRSFIKYIYSEDGSIAKASKGLSLYDNHFVYNVGEWVRSTKAFCEDPWVECGSGIHFFMTPEEALKYGEYHIVG